MSKLRIIISLSLLGLLSSCSESKNETFSEYRVDLKSEYQVSISGKITKKEYRGIITNASYGSSQSATYNLKIKEKGRKLIDSNLGEEEPKHLLICSNEILLHVVGEYYIEHVHSSEQEENKADEEEFKLETKARYKKLIDERYFLNLLGDVYWIVDEANRYNTLLKNNSDCTEYALPNENFYKDIR